MKRFTQIRYPMLLPYEQLKKESIKEGITFLHRLEADWKDTKFKFDKSGEGLFFLQNENQIIGIAGISQSLYAPPTSNICRLQRFYIVKNARQQGNGTLFLNSLLEFASTNFTLLRLFTKNPIAKKFYEKNGFDKIGNNPIVSHQIFLEKEVYS